MMVGLVVGSSQAVSPVSRPTMLMHDRERNNVLRQRLKQNGIGEKVN
ncbi:MAG: hypothetical protein J6Y19_10835 [Kiritimatiellae bacterium]|nr:hypothetical protein [Kiritimatiellia bacterium]